MGIRQLIPLSKSQYNGNVSIGWWWWHSGMDFMGYRILYLWVNCETQHNLFRTNYTQLSSIDFHYVLKVWIRNVLYHRLSVRKIPLPCKALLHAQYIWILIISQHLKQRWVCGTWTGKWHYLRMSKHNTVLVHQLILYRLQKFIYIFQRSLRQQWFGKKHHRSGKNGRQVLEKYRNASTFDRLPAKALTAFFLQWWPQHIEADTKCPAFFKRHFEMDFLD